MKRNGIAAFIILAAVLLSLFSCKNEKTEYMKTAYSREGVSDFIAATGMGGENNCYNITPAGAEGFSVFKYSDTGATFAFDGSTAVLLCRASDGFGYISGSVCDIGGYELIFTYSYSDTVYRCAAALYDKDEDRVEIIYETDNIYLYLIKMNAPIEGLADEYCVYSAVPDDVTGSKTDIGYALGSPIGTVEVSDGKPVFSPLSYPSEDREKTEISYEGIKKVVITPLSSNESKGVIYTEKADVMRAVEFVRSIELGEYEDEPDANSGESVAIGFVYEDGSIFICYDLGGKYFKFSGGLWRKITSGGDISDLTGQGSE